MPQYLLWLFWCSLYMKGGEKMPIVVQNNSNEDVEIIVSGDITSDCDWHEWYNNEDTYPKKIREALKNKSNSNIVVKINSGGGDVFSGFAIHNILKSHKGSTKAIIEGLCASSASIIAFGCDEIEMPKNTFLMIHKPSAGCRGDSTDFRKMADTLDTIQKGIVESYTGKKKENITDEVISEMIDNETWFTGDEAKEYFDIKVVDKIDVVNCVENINAKHIPAKVKELFNKTSIDNVKNASSSDKNNQDNIDDNKIKDDKATVNNDNSILDIESKLEIINKSIIDTFLL